MVGWGWGSHGGMRVGLTWWDGRVADMVGRGWNSHGGMGVGLTRWSRGGLTW